MLSMSKKKDLSLEQKEILLKLLKARFKANKSRHQYLEWQKVEAKLKASPQKLWSLHEMEKTGGEPDVIAYDQTTEEYLFYDCSPESPAGRRSICYDRKGLESRKSNKPAHNAIDMAADMGVELLTEEQYRTLQQLGKFDTKTSTWLKTPAEIRKLGGALYADFRYNQIFIYHNGAQSYYNSRAFRGVLRV
jgi:hypothetical protein